MKENVRQTKESSFNQYYLYITRDDLIDIFGDDNVVFTIKNNETMSLNDYVDNNETGNDTDGQVKDNKGSPRSARFSSNWKGIDVRLVTDNGESVQKPQKKRKTNDDKRNAEKRHSNQLMAKLDANEADDEDLHELKRGPGRPARMKRISEIKGGDKSRESVEDSDRRANASALLNFNPKNELIARNFDNIYCDLHKSMLEIILIDIGPRSGIALFSLCIKMVFLYLSI